MCVTAHVARRASALQMYSMTGVINCVRGGNGELASAAVISINGAVRFLLRGCARRSVGQRFGCVKSKFAA